MSKKVISSIANATVILTFLSVLSKGVGLLREMIYANNFGLTPQFDLFLVSAALPLVINTSIVYIAQHYFIPEYNRFKFSSEEQSHNFLNVSFWSFFYGGIVVSILLLICSKIILSIFISSQSISFQQVGLKIFILFLITIPLNAGMYIIVAYLRANFHFIYPAVSQIVMNVILIVIIFFFSNTFKIYVLPLAFIISYIIAFLILLYPVKREIRFQLLSIFQLTRSIGNVKIIIALVFIEILSLSYVLADRYFFSEIPSGSIAALNYALIIYSLPVSIFSISLITTFFSKFSLSSQNYTEQLNEDFKKAVSINFYIIIPITLLFIFWGEYFIRIFYQRGAFSSSDTIVTHQILIFYSLSLVFYSTYLVIVKLLYSINKYNSILTISIIAFILKVGLNFIFVNDLKQNGLALSTSFVYLFLFIIGFLISNNILKFKNRYFYITDLFYFTINGVLSYLISHLFKQFYIGKGIYTGIISLIIFLVVYVINSAILNDKEYYNIKKSLFSIIDVRGKIK